MIDHVQITKLFDLIIARRLAHSHADIAEQCGYDKSYGSRVTTGKSPLSAKMAHALSEKFGVSATFLATGDGPMLTNYVDSLDDIETLKHEVLILRAEMELVKRKLGL